MFEASTARDLSYFYRTFEQEQDIIFDAIRSHCKLGRYECIVTTKTVHLDSLLETLKDLGYYSKVIQRKSDHEQSTIIIKWENK